MLPDILPVVRSPTQGKMKGKQGVVNVQASELVSAGGSGRPISGDFMI